MKREKLEAWRRKMAEEKKAAEESATPSATSTPTPTTPAESKAPSEPPSDSREGSALPPFRPTQPSEGREEEQEQERMEEDEGQQKKWSLEDDDEDEAEVEEEGGKRSAAQQQDGDDDEPFHLPLPTRKKTDEEPAFVFGKPLPKALGKPNPAVLKPSPLAAEPQPPSVKKPEVKEVKEVKEMEEDEEDPLEAFMQDVVKEVKQLNKLDGEKDLALMDEDTKPPSGKASAQGAGEGGAEGDDEAPQQQGLSSEEILALAQQKAKKKELQLVDHTKVEYETFRKDFYIETPEIAKMTEEELKALRHELDGIKLRGVNCPKPIKNWSQAGLNLRILDVLKKNSFEKPTPIQAQAIPAIMSGRDVIGIAKTGSGKTLAFLLPMFRHIMDQRPLEDGEGPISLVLTPTRELALQIYAEVKKFTKPLHLRPVCAYGGSAIKDQIADLKRGAEIVVCTPGRMIDLLCANQGRVTNLQRVTYLVLDEADRMFDMGFEPQVMKIINNIRPDRQTVLFSATFPRQMEALARRVLESPVEIQVGGKSVVSDTVTQFVEVIEDEVKFFKLLEVLGKYYNPESRILVFVDTQDAADNLFKDLVGRGYPCLSLHGGKDQFDRDQILADFKTGDCPILIATSVAARGLDVKQLNLVINYEVPNHLEDYVHRCGRTGRAGNTGVAYTFITPEQDKYAGDIIKALKQSNQQVPEMLQKLWEDFGSKVKQGAAAFRGSGFGGRGLDRIEQERETTKKAQKKALGMDEGEEEGNAEEEKAGTPPPEPKIKYGSATATATPTTPATPATPALPTPSASTPTTAEPGGSTAAPGAKPLNLQEALKAARSKAASLNASLQTGGAAAPAKPIVIPPELLAAAAARPANTAQFFAEIEINDFPPQAKFRVTNKALISEICDRSGAAITTRGSFFPPGKVPREGERKLYLLVESSNQSNVDSAVTEIKRVLAEATIQYIDKK